MSTQYSDSELDALVLGLNQRRLIEQARKEREFNTDLNWADGGAILIGLLIFVIMGLAFFSGTSYGGKSKSSDANKKTDNDQDANKKTKNKWLIRFWVLVVINILITLLVIGAVVGYFYYYKYIK